MRPYCVYLHHFGDESHPFYVGATNTKNRPFNFKKRNALWHQTVKLSQKPVEVKIIPVASKEEASILEQSLIEKHRDTVCNDKRGHSYRGSPALLPTAEKSLSDLAFNIMIGRRRRGWSTKMLAERAGVSRSTVQEIEKGSPSVAIGNYINALFVLGFHEDLSLVGSNDYVGRKLQDALLLRSRKTN